ncbi:MAG TPA: efflux RND transporter periplasmic adaptor subunit, partial [Chitinophagaceae bacterium]|nr:efflux RND transporter periplasmic adaptor subunit [Chitinophagaceae bacterium]
ILILSACHTEIKSVEPVAETSGNQNEVVLSEAQFKNAGIQTTTLEDKIVSERLQVNGKIDVPPQNLVSVSMPIGGYLKSTSLLPGMQVSKGQVIATIEDPQIIQLQQDYLLARSAQRVAEADYNRQAELNKSQASSEKVLQQAEASLRNAKITASGLAEKLKLINIQPSLIGPSHFQRSIPIYSPIHGFVTKVNVNIGKYVTPNEILFELVDPSDIHLNCSVVEHQIEKLQIGQELEAFSNSTPDQHYKASIILISRDVNSSGRVEVHCHFTDYNPTLLPGMYMNAVMDIASHQSNVLPEESIVNFEGQDYVFIQIGKLSYQLEPVSIGKTTNGYLEVLFPEKFTGKRIVTTGAYTLLMKMKNTEE